MPLAGLKSNKILHLITILVNCPDVERVMHQQLTQFSNIVLLETDTQQKDTVKLLDRERMLKGPFSNDKSCLFEVYNLQSATRANPSLNQFCELY